MYASIRVELKEYVNENWFKWMKDKPDWFDESLICSIPDEFIPKAEAKRMDRESKVGVRRKSEIGDALGFGLGLVEEVGLAKVAPDPEQDIEDGRGLAGSAAE